MLNQIFNTIGKHKIPRYIYHLTNSRSYKSMIETGVIKASPWDDFIGEKAVFATDLQNLFKCWGKRSHPSRPNTLQENLILQTARGQDGIVILRIPTSKLDSDKLFIRSQDRLFDWYFSKEGEEAMKECGSCIGIDAFRKKVIEIVTRQKSRSYAENITGGTPAKMSGLYKQRNEAIEYIIKGDIPMSDVEKIGEVYLSNLRGFGEKDQLPSMRRIFMGLLKGTPEIKGTELLTC